MRKVRRVVTGTDASGRSVVLSDGPSSGTTAGDMWRTSAALPLGNDDVDTLVERGPGYEPAPGGTRWNVFEIPPADRAEGHRGSEFHTTETIDYVIVLDGRVTLLLDEGPVELETGDCVVQRRTAHAWRNEGPGSAHILVVMVSLRDQA